MVTKFVKRIKQFYIIIINHNYMIRLNNNDIKNTIEPNNSTSTIKSAECRVKTLLKNVLNDVITLTNETIIKQEYNSMKVCKDLTYSLRETCNYIRKKK